METRYHIGLLTGTLLILAILSYAYYADYNYRKEIARTEQTEQQETKPQRICDCLSGRPDKYL